MSEKIFPRLHLPTLHNHHLLRRPLPPQARILNLPHHIHATTARPTSHTAVVAIVIILLVVTTVAVSIVIVVVVIDDFPEHDVFAVEERGWDGGDEELGTVGVGAGVLCLDGWIG